jgi:hypothetical protein
MPISMRDTAMSLFRAPHSIMEKELTCPVAAE